MIEVKINGVDELVAKLQSVKLETRTKSGRSALRKAAKLVADAAKQNARRLDDAGTGRSIADNIDLRWNARRYKSTGDLAFRIGVMKGAVLPKRGEEPDKDAKAATPHWRLFEFGTEKMQAQPILRPALENNLQTAADLFAAEYMKGLDRAIKRAAKKGGIA